VKRLLFLLPFFAGQVLGYESRQTGRIRSEIGNSERKIAQLKAGRDALREEAVSYLVSAELLGKAAADAEFKKLGVDIMGMVNLNWTVANMCLMITGNIKSFLASVTSEVAGNVVVQYQFLGDVKLPSGDVPAPAREALDLILPLIVQDTEKEVAEAKKNINIVSDKVLGAYDQGSFNYQHILFRNYQKYLTREEARLRARFVEMKKTFDAANNDVDKEAGFLDGRRKLLEDQKSTDDLVAKNREDVARQEAEEEKRNQEKQNQLPKGAGAPGEGADAIDLSPELNDLKGAGQRLRQGGLTRQGYQKVREGAFSRASAKSHRSFAPPPEMKDQEAALWKKQQGEAAEKKQQAFFDEVEAFEKSLRTEIAALRKQILDEAAKGIQEADFNAFAFQEKTRDGQPRSESGLEWTPPDLAAGTKGNLELNSPEAALKAADESLRELPGVVKHQADVRQYFEAADKEFNDRQMASVKAVNNFIQTANEKIKEKFEFLMFDGSGDPSYAYRPEVDDPHHFTQNQGWDKLTKDTEDRATALRRDRESIIQGTESLAALRKKGEGFAERLQKTRSTGLGNVQARLKAFLALKRNVQPGTVSEWRTETAAIAKMLDGLSAGSIVQELALRRDEAEALQLEAGNYRAVYGRIKPVDGEFASFAEGYAQTAGVLSRDIEAAKKDQTQNSSQTGADASLTRLLADARTLLAGYRSEEEILRSDLARAVSVAEALAAKFEASAAKDPGGLSTDPATSRYFGGGTTPQLNSDKVKSEINAPLSHMKDWEYISDGTRPYVPAGDIQELRKRLSEAQFRIFTAAQGAGEGFQAGRVSRLLIEGKTFDAGSAPASLTLFKKGRLSDDLALEGFLEDPDDVRAVELSLDGGMTWQKDGLKITGARFAGKVALRPGQDMELKLRATARRGSASNPFPGPGRGLRIVYSTDDPDADLRQAVRDLFQSYEDESLFGFMRGVDDNFSGDRDNLEAAVKRDFSVYDSIRYRPEIDRTTSNPERDRATVDLHWRRSWLDTRSSRNETAEGTSVFRMEKTGNKWRLLSFSGTPVFGLTAETPLESTGGGLPVRSATLISHLSGGWGYAFTLGRPVRLVDGPFADITFMGLAGGLSGGGVYDMGASALQSVTEAPISGYSTGEPAMVGHVYVVRCIDGTYAKMRLTDVSDGEISFDWARQPNGSRSLR
jgi:hypothetical protein